MVASNQKVLRSIAVFEAAKGVLAILAVLGFFSLLHRDIHAIALHLIGMVGLDPNGHFPNKILGWVDVLQNTKHSQIILIALLYVSVRFIEAYGMWHLRRWAEWFGAISGGIYLPFELMHFIKHPTVGGFAVILLNALMVFYLLYQLRIKSTMVSTS